MPVGKKPWHTHLRSRLASTQSQLLKHMAQNNSSKPQRHSTSNGIAKRRPRSGVGETLYRAQCENCYLILLLPVTASQPRIWQPWSKSLRDVHEVHDKRKQFTYVGPSFSPLPTLKRILSYNKKWERDRESSVLTLLVIPPSQGWSCFAK